MSDKTSVSRIVLPGVFSDALLSEIISTMALCGDEPIAQMARFIKNMRRIQIPIESNTSRRGRNSYDQLLCLDLYFAMQQRGAISFEGELNLAALRGCVRR